MTKKTIEILLTAKNLLGKGLKAGSNVVNNFVSGAMGMLGKLKNMIFSLPGLITTVFTGLAARAVIKPAMDLEKYKVQFKTLLGSLDSAEKRIKDLTDFAANTPFELPGIAKASKILETLTRGALSTGKGLEMVGDTAAGVGAPIEELSIWFGRLYDGIQSGRPVGEAMARLQELGVVSGTARGKLEQLTASGASFVEKWAVISKETSRYNGLMKEMSATTGGLISTLKDNFSMALAEIGTEILPLVADATKELIAAIAELKASGQLQQFGKEAYAVLSKLFLILKGVTNFVIKNRAIIANLGFSMAGVKILGIAITSFKTLSIVVSTYVTQLQAASLQTNKLGVATKGLGGALSGITQLGIGIGIGLITKAFFELQLAISQANDAAKKFGATGELIKNNTFWGNFKDAWGLGLGAAGEVLSIKGNTKAEVDKERAKRQARQKQDQVVQQEEVAQANKKQFQADKKMQKNAIEEQIKRIEDFYIPELEKALLTAQGFDMAQFKNQRLDQLFANLKRGRGLNQDIINERVANGGDVMNDFFVGAQARKEGVAIKNAQARGWERDIAEQKRKELQEKNIQAKKLEEAQEKLRAGRHLSKKELKLLADEEKRKKVQVAQGLLQVEKDRKKALEKAKDDLQKKTFQAHLDEMTKAQADRKKMIQLLGNINGLPGKNELKNRPNINDQQSQVDLDETNNILRDINRNKVTVWQGAK